MIGNYLEGEDASQSKENKRMWTQSKMAARIGVNLVNMLIKCLSGLMEPWGSKPSSSLFETKTKWEAGEKKNKVRIVIPTAHCFWKIVEDCNFVYPKRN